MAKEETIYQNAQACNKTSQLFCECLFHMRNVYITFKKCIA
jgi:hypothetical protein